MKVLSIHNARSIWLFPTRFLNPNGSFTTPAIERIIDRYSFTEYTPLNEVHKFFEQKSLELKFGRYVTQDEKSVEVSLFVHSDGLVAETQSSTKISDAFLEDALTFLNEQHDMALYRELPIKKKYVSEIYFTLTETPEFFSQLTNDFVEKSSSYINSDKVGKFQFMGIHFTTDPDLSSNPPFIRVEREVGVPFGENRFFSTGSVKTCEHIKLLNGLEPVGS